MDNELEIVPNEVITNTAEAMPTNSNASQYLPIALGVGAGLVAGVLLCKFAIDPLLSKLKERKAAKKAEAAKEEPKTEE